MWSVLVFESIKSKTKDDQNKVNSRNGVTGLSRKATDIFINMVTLLSTHYSVFIISNSDHI